MTIEDELRDLIIEKYGSVSTFAAEIGMSNSTVYSILTRGVNNASVNRIIEICKKLGISTDELAKGRIVPAKEKPQEVFEVSDLLSPRKMRDVLFTLDGINLDETEKCLFVYAVEVAVGQIRRGRE